MSDTLTSTRKTGFLNPNKTLQLSAKVWFVVTTIGFAVFGYYIVKVYSAGALQGDWTSWNTVLPTGHGFVPGDTWGNVAFAAHMIVAAILTFGGALQLVPKIRAKAAPFHRWNGRLFMISAIIVSLSGLYINITRGNVSGFTMGLGNSLNGILILVFCIMAWRLAVKGQIADHRRWVLRAFVLIHGVWFLRVGMIVWFMINQGPAGMNDAGTGWFDIFWAFGHFLLPLAVMEAYLRSQTSRNKIWRLAFGLGLFVITLLLAGGTAGAFMFMWLPHLG
ncbi:DUF2306 domain-containing protein [Maritalea porphyrae]|jgi:uncharacterized membrane protein|uniref:DUF2306 domain-containing protein n=3 Tax=Maritalea TaxID=623276 RepID=UPI0022AF1A68|nr:DUF2306 domain-containing protein [Maritalea porphyrae]MCZ4271362.1 DUF2306 domain-containing protein [Maritalea porphyrae]